MRPTRLCHHLCFFTSACTFGFEFVDGKCKGSAPPGSSFCGASWADASTCKHPKCANEQDCPPDASLCFASITCGGPGPDPKNCNDPGTKTKCNSTDPNAYCGTSTDPAAQFNDGSGCSCDFGFTFNGVKCVGDPAKGTSYCGASWKDATTCTHGACHNADDCPAAAGNCYSSIDCK